jgi:hypothetical protein
MEHPADAPRLRAADGEGFACDEDYGDLDVEEVGWNAVWGMCPPLPPGEDDTCTHTPPCPT